MPVTRALASESVAASATLGNLSLSTARTASLSLGFSIAGDLVPACLLHDATKPHVTREVTMAATIDKRRSDVTRETCITSRRNAVFTLRVRLGERSRAPRARRASELAAP